MPLGERVTGGFLLPEVSEWDPSGQGIVWLAGRWETILEAPLSPLAPAPGSFSATGCG